LQTFYAEKFGTGVVEIVKDSNSVERDKLDPNKVWHRHNGQADFTYHVCYSALTLLDLSCKVIFHNKQRKKT